MSGIELNLEGWKAQAETCSTELAEYRSEVYALRAENARLRRLATHVIDVLGCSECLPQKLLVAEARAALKGDE